MSKARFVNDVKRSKRQGLLRLLSIPTPGPITEDKNGDGVIQYVADPTVNELERKGAELFSGEKVPFSTAQERCTVQDKEVCENLSEEEIRDKFDLSYHTRHVDTIFKRVFG